MVQKRIKGNKRIKRCKVEIVHDILNVTKNNNSSTKTKLQQMSYIDWRGFQKYFDFLLSNGFIKRNNSSEYEITEKGKTLLEQLNNFEKSVDLKI